MHLIVTRVLFLVLFFKQMTAYGLRISDWSSDVCSSYLGCGGGVNHRIGLFDAILIKENHILSAGSIDAAIRNARSLHRERPSSEERRVGKACVSTCRSRWSPYH